MRNSRTAFHDFVEMLKKTNNFARRRQIVVVTKRNIEIVCFSNITRIEAKGDNILVIHPKDSAKIEYGVSKDIIINGIDVNNLELNYYRASFW